MQAEIYALSPVKRADTVMLGDSLTENVPWAELTGRHDLVNRGVGGATSADILAMLPQVLRLHPKAVFLMVGVNDVMHGIATPAILANLQKIADVVTASDAQVFLSYVLPVAEGIPNGSKWNSQIRALNDAMKASFSGKRGVTFIDIRPQVTDSSNSLSPSITSDGVHLRAAAYRAWVGAVKSNLTKRSAYE
ncbi:MAG TPA: GDSL-type esterase/lipase family protein [Alphaproteobacteria bacterium]|nr:GDSL-type esterase/lipase family protein [Alphaproteobacteria bacterium]